MKSFLFLRNKINWLFFPFLGAAIPNLFILITANSHSSNGGNIFLTVVGLAGFFILFACNAGSFSDYCRELARLKFADEEISNRQEYIDAIKRQYKVMKTTLEEVLGTNVDKLPEQLVNKDSPVSSLVEGMKSAWDELIVAEEKLNRQKRWKIDIQRDIERRKLGLFSWVVDYYAEVK